MVSKMVDHKELVQSGLNKPVTRVTWLIVFFAVLVWSGIGPEDRFTWVLEVAPAVVGLIVLIWTCRRFPLTRLVYVLILIHCVILMVGGHYTYAKVPAFDWLAECFDWKRNNYDKLGHFAQGFIPAMIAREVFIRHEVVKGCWWLRFLIVSFCLGLSAFYELIEWAVALGTGESAEAFLGTQGDVWDTQEDMAWALFGAALALFVLGKWHDRQLGQLQMKRS